METEEYRKLWKDAIGLCEMEPNKEEAESFVWSFYYQGSRVFAPMDDRTLFITFVGLVVYEKKFQMNFRFMTPASSCYEELLKRVDIGKIDRDFIYDVGDWAADYSDNPYVPMGSYRGYGPRQYFSYLRDYNLRIALEQQAKKERIEKKKSEGKAKVEAAKQKHQERINTIRQLRGETVEDCLSIIEKSGKSVFYYYELIEEWFKNNSLNDNQKTKILSMFPKNSTRHNNRVRRYLETLSEYPHSKDSSNENTM